MEEDLEKATSRRLSKDADGTTSGGFIKKSDVPAIPIGNVAQSSCLPGTSIPSILNQQPNITGPLHQVGGVLHPSTTATTGLVTLSSSIAPLTAEQRLAELKKKIVEYKAMLVLLNDGAARQMMDLFLKNIERDLIEIEVELAKKPAKPSVPVAPLYPPNIPGDSIGPWHPQFPGPTWVGGPVNPGLDYTTVCAGKTCVEMPGKVESLSELPLTRREQGL